MRNKHHRPLKNNEILANAYISDDIYKSFPNGLPEELEYRIALEKLRENQVVRVYWRTGEFAVMPCMPGTNMPPPADIITAYHGCQLQAKTSKKGGFA
jgi:hypothetical protein